MTIMHELTNEGSNGSEGDDVGWGCALAVASMVATAAALAWLVVWVVSW